MSQSAEAKVKEVRAMGVRQGKHQTLFFSQNDICIFGFLIKGKSKHTDGSMNEAIDSKIRLRRLLNNYFYAFRCDDHCLLRIASVDAENWSIIRGWVEFAQGENLFGSLPRLDMIETPLRGEGEQAFRRACDFDVSDYYGSYQSIYVNYQDFLTTHKIPEYETEVVVDRYDANHIMCRREIYPDYHGSSFIEKVYPKLKFFQFYAKDIRNILEVGCGAGIFYEVLKRFCQVEHLPFPHYTGIDFSRNQILRAMSNYPSGTFLFGDAARLPYPDNYFDMVFEQSVLSFIPVERQLQALEEIIRCSQILPPITVKCKGAKYYKAVPDSLTNNFFYDKKTEVYYPDVGRVEQLVARHP